jgi:membrane protein DedA with SNARE-associated domain
MDHFFSSGFHELLLWAQTIEPGYIYLVLFLVALVENLFPPIPGDSFTLIGGYLAASGKISLIPMFLIIAMGTMSSVMLLYIIGFNGGHKFFERHNFRIFTQSDLARVDRWFTRHGAFTLLISRFIVGGRVAVAFGAGVAKYPASRMALYSSLSTIIFQGLLVSLAYLMHAYVDRVAEGFNLYSKIVLAVIITLVILWFIFLFRRFRHERKQI